MTLLYLTSRVCACFFVNSEVIDIFHPLPYFTCKLCVLKGPRTFPFTVKSWLIIKRRLYDFESLLVQRFDTKNSERIWAFRKSDSKNFEREKKLISACVLTQNCLSKKFQAEKNRSEWWYTYYLRRNLRSGGGAERARCGALHREILLFL